MSKGIKMRSAKDHHGHPYTVEAPQQLIDAGNSAADLVCDDHTCAVRPFLHLLYGVDTQS